MESSFVASLSKYCEVVGGAMRLIAIAVRAVDSVNRLVGGIVAASIVGLIVLILVEVILRYGFSAPTVWGTELTTLLFATYILLGGGYALLKGDHVRMDLLYGRLPPRGRAVLDLIAGPFGLLYCVVLLLEGGDMVREALVSQRTLSSDWAPLLWPWLLALPVGAGLLAAQVLANIVRSGIHAITGTELK